MMQVRPESRPMAEAVVRAEPSARLGRPHVDGRFFACRGQRLRIQGVTYGPFPAHRPGEPFPGPDQVADDFARMRALGINCLRTYHVPPSWLLQLATAHGLYVFVDVPWPKHLCFLDSAKARAAARQAVGQAAQIGRVHPCLFAYSIGNEIPPSVVRWHGARRIERFLAELQDVVKQADPEGLVTYGCFPPTEYLDLSRLDFATYNVYLHDPETFRRYLCRLHNLVQDKPLVLGEIGMDTLRHGEKGQAEFLGGHVREALLTGVAGLFIFSWTDEWHTGGHAIQDWAFGITHADRLPKASYHVLREVFETPLATFLPERPRVSVVVCSYNGGRTLDQCLRSLLALDYPDFEVIVVNDGSTDDTRSILERFPAVRALHQPNLGLSVARNLGLGAATGSLIAYTDSDCFADPHWLTHLVCQLQRSGAAAVGGPNLTPDDGWLAACVAAAPGQPTHVLESDQVAEHIPGCNMAFRREALEAINGFDPQFRKAGDDVDLCWRLQQAGYWITFAAGACVWHHRRQTPRTYLKQQAGYGEAEALLRFKHPDRFNGRGDGKWRGCLYGASLRGLYLEEPLIYRGTFGTGFFQCLYQPAPAHWAMLPSTLEWHGLAGLLLLAAGFWPAAGWGAAVMLALAFLVAGLQAVQARLSVPYGGLRARILVLVLCYVQPLVRSWKRYHTRLFAYRAPIPDPAVRQVGGPALPFSGTCTTAFWSETGEERTELLDRVIAYLNEQRWGKTLDTGWFDWDLAVYCHPWTVVLVCTAQEEHGSGKRLIRVRYRLRPSGYTKALASAGVVAGILAVLAQDWLAGATATALLAVCLGVWWSGRLRASRLTAVVNASARALGLIPCE